MFSFSECTTWLTTVSTLSVAIVTQNRNLRRRSAHLVINLAVVDMLVGGCVLDLFYSSGLYLCNLWKNNLSHNWAYIRNALHFVFPVASLTNMTVLSIERFHATFWPFRHRSMSEWVTAELLSVTLTLLLKF